MRNIQSKIHNSNYSRESSSKDEQSVFDISSVDIFSLARNGKISLLQTSLMSGIEPNSTDKNGNTILIIGAQNGNKSVVK